MKWLPGRNRGPTPQSAPVSKDQQLAEAMSPHAAGLTDDRSKSWEQYLQEDFGIEPRGSAGEVPDRGGPDFEAA
jgi:hypothetical protein